MFWIGLLILVFLAELIHIDYDILVQSRDFSAHLTVEAPIWEHRLIELYSWLEKSLD